jgi:hypothetical protein
MSEYCVIILITIIVSVVITALIFPAPKYTISVESYKDPIWMNKKKMYDDYYPRSNGSIYGTYYQPWDMFSGYPSYDRVY